MFHSKVCPKHYFINLSTHNILAGLIYLIIFLSLWGFLLLLFGFFCWIFRSFSYSYIFFIFFQNHQGQLEIFDENVAHISTWLYQAEALLDEIEKKSASQKEETVKVGNVVSSVNSWMLNDVRFVYFQMSLSLPRR